MLGAFFMQVKTSRVLGVLFGTLAVVLASALYISCGKHGLSGEDDSLRSGPYHVLTPHGSVVSVDSAGRTLTVAGPSFEGEGDTSQVTFFYTGSTSRWESIAGKAAPGTEVWASYHEGDLDGSGLTQAGGIYVWEDLREGAQGAQSWEEAMS